MQVRPLLCQLMKCKECKREMQSVNQGSLELGGIVSPQPTTVYWCDHGANELSNIIHDLKTRKHKPIGDGTALEKR